MGKAPGSPGREKGCREGGPLAQLGLIFGATEAQTRRELGIAGDRDTENLVIERTGDKEREAERGKTSDAAPAPAPWTLLTGPKWGARVSWGLQWWSFSVVHLL